MNQPVGDPRIGMASDRLAQIRTVILVCSAKGGVGKSTVAAGLALSFSRLGKKVGLLDLDVQGTSLSQVLNVQGVPAGGRSGLSPCVVDGVKVVSVSTYAGEETLPVRGEALEGLIMGLLSQVNWGGLEYLLVDMPPGMGEELMTLIKMVGPKAWALLVTTGSRMSVSVVSRMASLLKAERVKILGVVQNMSYVTCKCGEVMRPFGTADLDELGRITADGLVFELPIDPGLEEALQRRRILDAPELGKGLKHMAQAIDSNLVS